MDIQHDHYTNPPLDLELHLMVCFHRKRKMMHQFGRIVFVNIYALVHTFHYNSSKVHACIVPPIRLEIPFGPSRFVLNSGWPLDEDVWKREPSRMVPEGCSLLPWIIDMPATR
jgi:hypothetical protein